MFQHFNKFPIWHHRLVITTFKHFLLFFKTLALIDRIVQFTVTIPHFWTRNNRLESFHFSWEFFRNLSEWRNQFWMIHQKSWSSNLFTHVFPECIGQSFAISSFVFYAQFFQFLAHFVISRCQKINSCAFFYRRQIINSWPFTRKVKF